MKGTERRIAEACDLPHWKTFPVEFVKVLRGVEVKEKAKQGCYLW